MGQGPIALAVGAVGVVWTFFLSSITSFLSPSLWETAGYRPKYCIKGPLSPKQTTNQKTLKHFKMSKTGKFVFHCNLYILFCVLLGWFG